MTSSSAQFLVQSLLADALLLDQWGTQVEADSSEVLASDPQPVSDGLDRRREINRESMRRTRQRKKQDTERKRETLDLLSQQFKQLCDQQRAASNSKQRSNLEASYATLAETTHRLKAENFHLERLLMEYEKNRLRVIHTIDSFSSNSDDSEDHWAEPAAQYFEYVAITKAHAQAAISASYRRIMDHDKTARPLADWIGGVGNPMRTFGWSVKCEISSGHNFFLSMTKTLAGVTAADAVRQSWATYSEPRREKNLAPRIARSQLLQVIDDSTRVMGLDWCHPVKPGVRMRSIAIRFYTKTERGFAFGLCTVNPQDSELRTAAQDIEYRDGFTWHDYDDKTDGSGCVVTVRRLIQYNTMENMQLRLVNCMSLWWQWEQDVVKKPVNAMVFE